MASAAPAHRTVIEPRPIQRVDVREVLHYQDLLYFFVWRDIKTRYAQTVLGLGWAIVQPLCTMVMFTLVFGRLARVASDGAPYAAFSFAALVPWTYFSGALTGASGSVLGSAGMLSKVYFPRVLIPLVPVLGKLIDLLIAIVILLAMTVALGITPSAALLVTPLLIALMMATAIGLGLWLSALTVQYRDVSHALGFGTQLFMYASPVVYPASLIPQRLRWLYAMNPMAGVIEGFRSAFLHTNPMPWDMIGIGAATSLALLWSGSVYFRRKERLFADIL